MTAVLVIATAMSVVAYRKFAKRVPESAIATAIDALAVQQFGSCYQFVNDPRKVAREVVDDCKDFFEVYLPHQAELDNASTMYVAESDIRSMHRRVSASLSQRGEPKLPALEELTNGRISGYRR